jgi:hypothetical protein
MKTERSNPQNPVRTICQDFESANILSVELKHNGYCGGDAGHGGYVKIKFSNTGNMSLNGESVRSFEILFEGDCERDTLIDALKMIIKELNERR